jgi:protoporphyrinogen oxidase
MTATPEVDVLIIGAGIAGLTAAKVLKDAGKAILIVEASETVGGRVKTDHVGGFLLDRGFQVLLTAYPEAKRFLNYDKLDLQPFSPGAMVLTKKGITQIDDPLRQPATAIKTLFSPVGTLADKFRVLGLKIKLHRKTIEDIFTSGEITTLAYLKKAGFTDGMISLFFRPFMTGIFLENQLKTSSRMFEFVFKMFSEGDTAIPAKGMGMIPLQLAEGLMPDELVFQEKVIAINGNEVETVSGRKFYGKYVLIATDGISMPFPFNKYNKPSKSVINIYFTAKVPPFMQRLIALNAMPNKLVNNIAVMDRIASDYSTSDKSLISVSLIGQPLDTNVEKIVPKVIDELKFWYPDAVNWEYLKAYHIPYALPIDEHVVNEPTVEDMRLSGHCFICGDHLLNGSINAAMKSGRLAAEAIINVMN